LNYYIYYKAKPDQVAALRRAVESLFSKVEKECGVRGRWMRRRDDPTTYMEVYEDVKNEQAFEALLAREAPALGPERRLERFEQA
jgi:quinol monooxygenase YgiN